MTDNLNINGNQSDCYTTAEEFKEDSEADMISFSQEMTITKTEVKEEIYDFEIAGNDFEYINVKDEYISSPENRSEEESSMLTNNTERPTNENLDVGSYGIREVDLQSNKNTELDNFAFDKQAHLNSLYQQSPPGKRHMAVHKATSKQYKCNDCEYVTRWKKCLVLHTYNHTGVKPYKCTYKDCKCTPGIEDDCACNTCEYTTVNVSRLKRHILSKHSTEPKHSVDREKFKCNNCEFATHWKKSLVIHIRRHTGERPYKCKYKDCKCTPGQEEPCECNECEYTAIDATNLRRHILSKHSVKEGSTHQKKFKCKDCEYVTRWKKCLVSHSRNHTIAKPYKCTYKDCKCTPGQEEPCECSECEYTAVDATNLRRHIFSEHSTETTKRSIKEGNAHQKIFKCKECDYVTRWKKCLLLHTHHHTGEKPYKCTYKDCKCIPRIEEDCVCNTCEYTTVNVSRLKSHILSRHSVDREKFKCKNCDFATHWKKSLVIHIRSHTGERPYKCKYKDCKCTPGQEEPCECNECEYTAMNASNLRQHILSEHSTETTKLSVNECNAHQKKFKCKDCEYVTRWKKCLVLHAHNHTGEKPYKCTYKVCKCTPGIEEDCTCNKCEYTTVNVSRLKSHILSRHSVDREKFKCKNCEFATYWKKSLVIHIRSHTGERPYKCKYKDCKCTPGQEEPCECNGCEYTTVDAAKLRRHILSKHTIETTEHSAHGKKFKCKDCEYVTRWRKCLVLHNRNHTGEKPYKCTYKDCKCTPGIEENCACKMCEHTFVSEIRLETHILSSHSTEPEKYSAHQKKFKCKDCEYVTRWKKCLVLHTRTHTGEKPFKCTYKDCKCTPGIEEDCACNTCEHTFASKIKLQRHILSKHNTEPKKHSADQKKFKCKDCQFVTHWKKSLVIHARSHTGERPYKCKYKDCKCIPGQEEPCECRACEFAAVDGTSLRRHTISKHNIESKKRSA